MGFAVLSLEGTGARGLFEAANSGRSVLPVLGAKPEINKVNSGCPLDRQTAIVRQL